MKKIFFILTFLIFFNTKFVLATEENKKAGYSSIVSYKKILYESNFDLSQFTFGNNRFFKKYTIKKVLERYKSPLKENIDDFIRVCINHEIDCYLLPSIAGLESTFGHYIFPDSFNPFGWGGGYIIFKDFKEAIEKVASSLKNNYLNRGLLTVEQIATVYSESPIWAKRVRFFIREFEKEENNLRLYFEKYEVKL